MKFTNDFISEPFKGVIHTHENTEYRFEQLMGVIQLLRLIDKRFEEIYVFLKNWNIDRLPRKIEILGTQTIKPIRMDISVIPT